MRLLFKVLIGKSGLSFVGILLLTFILSCTSARYMIVDKGDEQFIKDMGYKIVKVEKLSQGIIKVYYK